jgi:ADP-ribosylglycohydrolase
MNEHVGQLQRLALARLALDGLSVGDAFGERFFGRPERVARRLAARELPPPPWAWTDDTAMAISIVEVLRDHRRIDRDALAFAFARRHAAEPNRGYGAGARQLLDAVYRGVPWREAASSLFGGMGSYGNGGAMRVAPVGAYFWDDDTAVVKNAAASADPTHAHPEGRAGAIAVAAAATAAARIFAGKLPREGRAVFDLVLTLCPEGETRRGIVAAAAIPPNTEPEQAAAALGSGQRVSAADTVPYCLWCAARHLDDFEAVMWITARGLGDRDTTCAIVGGIVALAVGADGMPASFRAAREPLPALLLPGE